MSENGHQRGTAGLASMVRAAASDDRSRTLATTVLATCWDLVYAIYLAVTGHRLNSLRMTMTSVYYLSLVGVSACILVGLLAAGRAHDGRARDRRELVTALVGSILLLAVNAVVALVIKRSGDNWRAADYTEASFYMLASYTIVMLVLTVRGWARFRRDASPAIALSKGLSLCKAVMTLFFLALAASQRYTGTGVGFLSVALGGAERYAGVTAASLSFVISVIAFVRSTRGLWMQRPLRVGRTSEEDDHGQSS